jgi:aryl-alcohol dehydrogenase-like predicted oxidoreductase
MKMRRLGRNGPLVSAIGLGCMGMTPIYGMPDDAEVTATIHRAIDLGVNFLDSSDAYASGKNEEVIGRALKGKRDKVVLATKFGQKPWDNDRKIDSLPEYVAQACEASLKRLGLDHIDVYFQHRVDLNVPVEDTVGAMAKLVEQGKVKHLGLCEATPQRVAAAHKVHPIAAVQSEYSLLYPEIGIDTRKVTRDLGISFVAYAPLGRSLLTGHVPDLGNLAEGDTRGRHPRFMGDNFAKNRELVQRIEAIAEEKGCTPAQLCLAWLLAQGPDVIPIPGTKRIERLEENFGAMRVRLTEADIDRVSIAIPIGAAAGTRYPEGGMRGVYI